MRIITRERVVLVLKYFHLEIFNYFLIILFCYVTQIVYRNFLVIIHLIN